MKSFPKSLQKYRKRFTRIDNLSKRTLLVIALVCASGVIFSAGPLKAQNLYVSNNYQVIAPVLYPGEYSTSTHFSLNGVISQFAIGTSTITSFDLFGGFLYFPFVSTPTVSATAGSSLVDLTWTSADASTGWAVGSYEVGQSTTSGGPYSFSNVGNVLASTRTGLTNGTTYYFILHVQDALGYTIATSSEVSAMPVSSGGSGGSGGSGSGGGSGGGGMSGTGVILSGRAYPLSKVVVLKDGALAVNTIAGPDSLFRVAMLTLSPGSYTFSLYGEDKDKIKSSPFTFPITVMSGVVTEVSGIFIAPTISVDKSEVKRGDTVTIFGQSAQSSEVMININSDQEFFVKQNPDANGVYLVNFDTSPLELGRHTAKSKSAFQNEISYFSYTAAFAVGLKNVFATIGNCKGRADLNSDCSVNLVDFSIAAYWYKRPLSTSFAVIEKERLNGDAKIDLIDFSIMAYNWTG